LSIRDLCETIVERLKINYGDPLLSDINIPSNEWIRLQFCPTNATTMWAAYYTNDKYKVLIGEDVAVFTGIRNRHSIVRQE
ncbi:6158_t:CDS:2, partial [Racocetra persica]